MKIHELKILTEYFNESLNSNKPFELRKNDRNFQKGEIVILEEYCDVNSMYTGNKLAYEITYVLKNCQFGIDKDYCILGLRQVQCIYEKINKELIVVK